MRVKRLAFCAVLVSSVAVTAPALAVPVLQAHRAVYDLSLDKASDRSGITGITGCTRIETCRITSIVT